MFTLLDYDHRGRLIGVRSYKVDRTDQRWSTTVYEYLDNSQVRSTLRLDLTQMP